MNLELQVLKKRGKTTRFPTSMPAANSPALVDEGSAALFLYQGLKFKVGLTHVHTPTRVKSKVASWLPLLMVLKTKRSMLAARALVFSFSIKTCFIAATALVREW